MAVTFPPNPNVGDTVTDPATGAVWQWNGVAWVAQGMGAGGFLPLAGGTMTGPLAMNGAAATVTLSGNAAQPLQAVPLQQVEGFTGNNIGRNYIHNPMFNINQRGQTSYPVPIATGTYGLDRWAGYAWATGDSLTMVPNAFADAGRAAIGDENAEYQLQSNFAGGNTPSNEIYLVHRIEDIRRLSGKTLTLSFWASASAAGLRMGLAYNQNFGLGGAPSPNVTGNIALATLTTNWVRYSYTFTMPSSAGKTFGTTTGSMTSIMFWLSCPSSSPDYALSGGLGVQSGTIALWGVQLEVGSIATPFEHRDPQVELALCMRFYQLLYNLLWNGNAGAGTDIYGSWTLPVTMRVGPSVSVLSPNGANAGPISVNATLDTTIALQFAAVTTGSAWAVAAVGLSADF